VSDQQFDNLAKKLARPISRRQAFKIVAASAAAGLFPRFGSGAAFAGGGNSDAAHWCTANFPPGPQRGSCTSAAVQGSGPYYQCGPGSNGSTVICNGVCCGPNQTCSSAGHCVCAPDSKLCNGRCINKSLCCFDTECGTGEACVNGTCMCGNGPSCGSSGTCTSGVCMCGDAPACATGQTCIGLENNEFVCAYLCTNDVSGTTPPCNNPAAPSDCVCVATAFGSTECVKSGGYCSSTGDCFGCAPGDICYFDTSCPQPLGQQYACSPRCGT
jgi:hypothetical protein